MSMIWGPVHLYIPTLAIRVEMVLFDDEYGEKRFMKSCNKMCLNVDTLILSYDKKEWREKERLVM